MPRYVVKHDALLREPTTSCSCVPYSPETHHTIGAAELALMKPTATLTNIARGGIVDDAALADALREGRIAAAGLDVFEGEPSASAAARSEERRADAAHRQRSERRAARWRCSRSTT